MSLVRHRQRVLTALFPHAGNRRFLVGRGNELKGTAWGKEIWTGVSVLALPTPLRAFGDPDAPGADVEHTAFSYLLTGYPSGFVPGRAELQADCTFTGDYVPSYTGPPCTGEILGQAEADAPPYDDANLVQSDWTQTTARTAVSLDPATDRGFNSWDVTAVVQEVLAVPGFWDGNRRLNLAFFSTMASSPNQYTVRVSTGVAPNGQGQTPRLILS